MDDLGMFLQNNANIIADVFLPIASLALAIFLAISNYKKDQLLSTQNSSAERLNKIYSPLFHTLEPYMLLSCSDGFERADLHIVKQIIYNVLPTVGGDLRLYYVELENAFDNMEDTCQNSNQIKEQRKARASFEKVFTQFCHHVAIQYDSLSKKLGIPLRKNKQMFRLYKKEYYRMSRISWGVQVIFTGVSLFFVLALNALLLALFISRLLANDFMPDVFLTVLLLSFALYLLAKQTEYLA